MSFMEPIYEMLEKDRGKVIYFDFWVKWCPPCLTEMEPLKQLRSKYSTKIGHIFYMWQRTERGVGGVPG